MEPGRRTFRFAISGSAPTRAGLQDFARKAENLGYSSLLIPDHFGPQLSPLPALLMAAAATTSLRVGTLVFCNDFRNPAIVAKDAATADVLTDGRFELGLGAGWMLSDYEGTGIPFDPPGVRLAKLEEALHVVKAFFTQETVDHEGRFYHMHGLTAAPKPLQKPHPPILMGGSGPRMLALIGREADIANIEGHPDPPRNLWGAVPADHFQQQLAWLKEAAGDRYPRIEISILADVHITDDRDSAADRLAAQFGVDRETVLDMPAVFIGSVEAIEDQLLERRERFDISYPVLFAQNMDRLAPLVARLSGR